MFFKNKIDNFARFFAKIILKIFENVREKKRAPKKIHFEELKIKFLRDKIIFFGLETRYLVGAWVWQSLPPEQQRLRVTEMMRGSSNVGTPSRGIDFPPGPKLGLSS